MKNFLLGALVVALIAILWAWQPWETTDLLAGGGLAERECDVNTVTAVTVGNDLTTTIATATSSRTWMRIAVADGEVEPVWISFNKGEAATVGNGIALTATSSTYIDFGRNTDFPYTGAVTGITKTSSTTVQVTSCNYN